MAHFLLEDRPPREDPQLLRSIGPAGDTWGNWRRDFLFGGCFNAAANHLDPDIVNWARVQVR
jgi:hypothetical protein